MATLPNGTTVVLAKRTYQAGTFISPAVNLLPTQSRITLTTERDSWPDTGGDVVSASISIFYDGGSTFNFLVGFTAPGGDITNPWTQQVDTASSVTFDLPQVGNTNRQLIASATLSTQITTQVSVTVS